MLLPCGNACFEKRNPLNPLYPCSKKNKRQEDSTRYPFNPYNPCSKNTQLLI